MSLVSRLVCFVLLSTAMFPRSGSAGDLADFYHHDGPLAGTLKSDAPLPIYDPDPQHVCNRLFAACYIRPRIIPGKDGQPETIRYEGGDVIEFLAWGRTEYWSTFEMYDKLAPLLDEFMLRGGTALIADPLKRAVFQHDLWAVYDHLVDQNIKRTGDEMTRRYRLALCINLAHCIQLLALSDEELKALPDTYALAVKSGAFVPRHDFDAARNYLPHGLLTNPDEWVEIDFYFPKHIHEDITDRFITLHSQSLLGRSHYRIFYRFPEGRPQVVEYLKQLEATGIDWKQAAQSGFVATKKDAPPIPVGTEVVLLQLMMSINDKLEPVPTKIVESFQFRAFANIDGKNDPPTNTGVGVNVLDIRMKRHLLFDGLKAGGLEREPEDQPQYRVAVDGLNLKARDWGHADKSPLFQQCVECHMGRKLERLGVASIPSIVHSGGFDAGAQMGVAHPLDPAEADAPALRVAKFKGRHESFRRLLEYLGR